MPELDPLNGRVAIITGGGSGIGRAFAEGLARAGCRVVIAGRRAETLEREAAELTAMGGGAVHAHPTDIRVLASVQDLVNGTVAVFGRVDLLINNAGLAIPERLNHVSNDHWDTVMDTNLRGAFWLTREVLHHMKRQNFGDIVNVSSQAGKHGYADVSSYCASKFALLGMANALKAELAADKHDIRVFNLCPGMVDVDHTGPDETPRPGALHVRTMVQTLRYLLTLDRDVNVDDLGLTAR